jgi:hypothetical protein
MVLRPWERRSLVLISSRLIIHFSDTLPFVSLKVNALPLSNSTPLSDINNVRKGKCPCICQAYSMHVSISEHAPGLFATGHFAPP